MGVTEGAVRIQGQATVADIGIQAYGQGIVGQISIGIIGIGSRKYTLKMPSVS